MEAKAKPRVALVHDWLTGMRGGEKCLEALCRRWPHARLFTLLHQSGSVSEAIERLGPQTSFLQHFPGVHRYYRYLLPVLPFATRWPIQECDLVVSFSHCVAKAALAPAGRPHVCYCFTPMRYAWHMREAYFGKGRFGRARGFLLERLLERLRRWDRETANRVSHFIAISGTVQQRIRDCYDRASDVIYPPVDTAFYCPAAVPRDDYYLAVSAFAPYKRLDLAIEVCNRLGKRLVVIGTGQDERRLRSLAGPTIHFLGWQPNEVIRDHFRRCRALLFPGEEDFGIVPVEAQACGAPVIAFGKGGATETVVPWGQGLAEPTGTWFEQQSVDCLVAALETFQRNQADFAPANARRQSLRFTQRRFTRELFDYLDAVIETPQQKWAKAG
jgi:glycosyltransferase involved in cell wall biosynthesis